VVIRVKVLAIAGSCARRRRTRRSSALAEVLRTMNLRLVDGGAHQFARARLDAAGEVRDAEMLAVIERGLAALAAAAA
jgi:hypothetical protein